MYSIDILGTEYPLRFGLGFLREMNKKATQPVPNMKGVTQDVGLSLYIALMIDGDIEALMEVLKVANKTESPKLTNQVLEEWLEDDDTDIDAVFDTVIGFLSTANVSKRIVKRIRDAMEQNQSQTTETQ